MAELPPHTIRHGNKFKVRLFVPRALRAKIGKAFVTEILDTDSVAEAKRLQPFALAKLRAMLSKAEGKSTDALSRAWQIAKLLGSDDEPSDDARQREKRIGVPGYARVESGNATPLLTFKDEWLGQLGLKRRSEEKARQSLAELTDWLKARNLPLLFDTVDRKLAYEYRDKELAKRHPETANSLLGGLRKYWDWAIERQKFDGVNHWRAVKTFSKRQAKSDRQRAFRDEELKALFAPQEGETERMRQQLLPLMSLALASGARLSELCALRVRDVMTGDALKHKCHDLDIGHSDCPHGALFFRVTEDQGKTASAERLTPVHSAVAHVVAKLIHGKKPDDLLFADDRRKRKGSTDRPFSFSLTQKFERYRINCRVHDREGDRSRSRVTFHSFRHSFIDARTKVITDGTTGFNHYTVADVVGHSKGDMPLPMTAENYSASSPLKARMACVEAVSLAGIVHGQSDSRKVRHETV